MSNGNNNNTPLQTMAQKFYFKRCDLEKAQCDSKGKLDLSGKELSKITKHLCLLENLRILDISNNKLTFLFKNLRLCTNLVDLRCSGNYISEIDLNDMDWIEALDCSQNKLVSLRIEKCRLIKRLNVQNNFLSKLLLPPNATLQSLFVEGNSLVEIPNIPPNSFQISLSANRLTQSVQFCTFSECRNLYIQKNRILIEQSNKDDLLRLLPQEIVTLDTSDNGVRWWELPPTTVFSGLQKLVLANNKMESFTVGESLPNLTYLDLSYNELTHIDVSSCKKLSVLLARKNLLAKIVFSVESCTEHIDISYNSFKDISHILERMTGTLQDFNAEGNLLEKIPALCFQNTPNIKRLNLSKNVVEKISKSALAPLHQIQFMNLSNNLLQNIPQDVLDVKTLEKILLFRCPLEKSVAEYIQSRVDLQHKIIL